MFQIIKVDIADSLLFLQSGLMAVNPMYSLATHTDLVHPKIRPVLSGKKVYVCEMNSRVHLPRLNGRQWQSMWRNGALHSRENMIEANGLHYIHRHRIGIRFKKVGKVDPFILCSMRGDAKSTLQNVFLKDCLASDGSVSDNTGKQLKVLDSYFSKLNGDVNDKRTWGMSSSVSQANSAEAYEKNGPQRVKDEMDRDVNTNIGFKIKSGLGSLDSYFDKLNPVLKDEANETQNPFIVESSSSDLGHDVENEASSSGNPDEQLPKAAQPRYSTFINAENCENGQSIEEKVGKITISQDIDDAVHSAVFTDKTYDQSGDEGSDFLLVNMLISLNVAIFLFEIASPVGNTNLQQLSLPLIYGAKINKLILDGEWWRLVTPMFLHSGLLHVAFSSWTLFNFGPQVRRGYGSFTFFLIYVLGGICANITSFIHTPELTVSGTGPVFGLIGAWLIYQFQNKDMISDKVSENMYWKAVIATALSFLLSDGQTDEWMHLGAAFSGVLFGYFTSLDNTSIEDGRKENIALLGQQADPWKSLLTFIIFMIVLFPMVYMLEPDLYLSNLGNLVEW